MKNWSSMEDTLETCDQVVEETSENSEKIIKNL